MTEATHEDQVHEGESADSTQERLRKAIASRVQRVLSSEEGVKAVVNAVVPRELIASTLEQVDGARNEAVAIVGREMRNFLEHLDVGEEIAKILTSVSFEVRLEVRFIPNEDGSLKASVRGSGRPRAGDSKSRRRRKKTTGQSVAETPEEAPEEAEAQVETAQSDAAADSKATPSVKAAGTQSASAEPDANDDSADSSNRRRLLSRGTLTSMVQNVADVAATTARVAAEVAADAAAEVVNEARRGRDDDDDYDDD